MPKLERLSWLVPLSEGRGITLTDKPEADLFLAENPLALLLGVLYDSQYATKAAFTSPLRLRERLGYLDAEGLASANEEELVESFRQKPALHRFPRKNALLTQRLAAVVVTDYGGDASRLWRESSNVTELRARIMALPAFGAEKTNWTVGMLGRLGMLQFDGWEEGLPPIDEEPVTGDVE